MKHEVQTTYDDECVSVYDIAGEGFDWLIQHAVAGYFNAAAHVSPKAWKEAFLAGNFRVQWDSERDRKLDVVPPIGIIQLGLSGSALADMLAPGRSGSRM